MIHPPPFLIKGARRLAALAGLAAMAACSPSDYRQEADEAAYGLIEAGQAGELGRTEPFTIDRPSETLRRRLLGEQALPVSSPASLGSDRLEPIESFPDDAPERTDSPVPVAPWEEGAPVALTLVEALQVGARNSRNYQAQKEAVFLAALDLDLAIDAFRNTYTGFLQSILGADRGTGATVTGLENTAGAGALRQLQTGAALAGNFLFDVVKLLTDPRSASLGIFADATVTIPLLRGSGRDVVTEAMTQAERELIYALRSFERFKRTFAVDAVQQYYAVLQAEDKVRNSAESYRNQIASTRQAAALAEEGRRAQEQLDQARQAELSARNAWVRTIQEHRDALDGFKIFLGLPADARVVTDREEFDRLRGLAGTRISVPEEPQEEVPAADEPIELAAPTQEGAGPYELDESRAVELALQNRLDLRTSDGRVVDAQRAIRLAADALGPELTLVLTGVLGERRTAGTEGLPNAELKVGRGFVSAAALADLPIERTIERNAYREAWIGLEVAVRAHQALEDLVKLDVRGQLRDLLQQRESFFIQLRAEAVAERRVERTRAFVDLGRVNVSVRDVNEAQADLLRARNAVTAALISYRISELELQRDLGLLGVSGEGLFTEPDLNADE